MSLVLSLPFLFMQALATSFAFLLLARFFFVFCHVIATPARTLLLQQWAAPHQYAQINSVGLSQHSVILALAVSTSALSITGLGSWRTAYLLMGGLLLAQTLAWVLVAQDRKAKLVAKAVRFKVSRGSIHEWVDPKLRREFANRIGARLDGMLPGISHNGSGGHPHPNPPNNQDP